MAATATNESWKPGPAIAQGSSASTAAAASASRCQGSRADPISQASETSTPVAAARTTDGPPPTIAAYAATAGIAHPCASARGIPATQARPSTAATSRTMLPPDTASRCASPDARNASSVSSSSAAVPPSATPVAMRADSSSPPAASAARAPRRSRSSTPWRPPAPPDLRRASGPPASRARPGGRARCAGRSRRCDGGTGASEPLTTTIAPCCSAPRARSSTGWPSRRAIAELPYGPGRGWPSITSRAPLDVPDERAQRIGGARREPVRRPGRARERAGDGRRRRSARRSGRAQWREDEQREHHERAAERTRRGERGQREPGREPGRGRDAELVDAERARHSASRGRSASRRTGPMPLTSSSSSTERNPPCAAR